MSCGEREKRKVIDSRKSDSTIVHELIQTLNEYNPENTDRIDSLGNKLSSTFSYYGRGNEYDKDAVLISSATESNFDQFMNALNKEKFNCKTFQQYKVCIGTNKNGLRLRCSTKPHPTLNWIFTIESMH